MKAKKKKIVVNISVFILKVCRRLRLGAWAKVWSYWLMRMFERPKNINMTLEEAEKLLQAIYPDHFSSALCENMIIKPAEYDLQIVVPVYKVESFLEECLQSVLDQKTKYSYHIVAVNDGSPDKCGELLKKYENDERITVITQENRGLSSARNAALNIIRAKYITFLDSDDLLAPYAIERLLDAAYKYDVDIVEGSYRRRTIDGKLFSGERCLYNGVSSREKLKGFSCMKVIKAEIFEHIHFPEGYWSEDTLMGMLVIPLAQSFATIKDDVYYYTCNANSISFMSYDSYKSIDGVYITRSLLMDAKKCGALETAPEYQYHHFLQQIRNNWMRTHRLSSDIELAMFVIACDLWEKYFSKGSHCAKKHLMNMESALMTKDFNKFRKTCCVDF